MAAAAAPAVAPVNRQGVKKTKTVKARVPKAGTSKDGPKRKRVKQETSDGDEDVNLDWSDEEIGGAATDDDEDQTAEKANTVKEAPANDVAVKNEDPY